MSPPAPPPNPAEQPEHAPSVPSSARRPVKLPLKRQRRRLLKLAAKGLCVTPLIGAASCVDSSAAATRVPTPPHVPGEWKRTPKGIQVFVPAWLLKASAGKDGDDSYLNKVYQEIETTTPDPDERLPALPEGTVGPPPGYAVWIQDPGLFSSTASPTGLASGQTNLQGSIWCAWRVATDGPLLPALAHEYGHCWHGLLHGLHAGNCAGHEDQPCAPQRP